MVGIKLKKLKITNVTGRDAIEIFDNLNRSIGIVLVTYNSIKVYIPSTTEVRVIPKDRGEGLLKRWLGNINGETKE